MNIKSSLMSILVIYGATSSVVFADDNGTVNGVIRTFDGIPLTGVGIRIVAGDSVSAINIKSVDVTKAVSDADGKFKFTGLPNGVYAIGQYGDPLFDLGGTYQNYFISPDITVPIISQEVRFVEYIAKPGATVIGNIRDSDNQILQSRNGIFTRNANPSNLPMGSDVNGIFRIRGVDPDVNVNLYVLPSGYNYYKRVVIQDSQLSPGVTYNLPTVVFQKLSGIKNITGSAYDDTGVLLSGTKVFHIVSSDRSVCGSIITKNGVIVPSEYPLGDYVVTNYDDELSAAFEDLKYARFKINVNLSPDEVEKIRIDMVLR